MSTKQFGCEHSVEDIVDFSEQSNGICHEIRHRERASTIRLDAEREQL